MQRAGDRLQQGAASISGLAGNSLGQRVAQLVQPGSHIHAQMDADHASPLVPQRLEIPQRLRLLQSAEGVWFTGDGEIVAIIRGELDEEAVVRSALVELPSGMEEARPIAQGRGDA